MKNKSRSTDLLPYIFIGILVLGIAIGMAGITPAGPKKISYNFTAMYIALGCGIIFFLSGIGFRVYDKKTLQSWIALYLFSISTLPTMFGILSLNLVYAGFQSWLIVTPLGGMYIIAALLPFINEWLSETLHHEIFAPRSCLGRIIQVSILAFGPIGGVFGAFLSGLAGRSSGVMGYAIMGLCFHLLFVWGTISMAQQAWERRPWNSINKE